MPLFPYLLSVIAFLWPSYTLVYPLYASVRAIESHLEAKNRQCLAYWVVIVCLGMLKTVIAPLLERIPFWHYVKGITIIVLSIRCFGGAYYVYNRFLRPYVLEIFVRKLDGLSVESIPGDGSINLGKADDLCFNLSKADDLVNVVERETIEVENHEPDRFIQENKPVLNYKATERENNWPVIMSKVQKEWCCALCLICTSSEKCLIQHFKGKKHREKVDLILYKETKKNGRSSMFKKTSVVIIENCCKLLGPGMCRWEKPESGWTKLNTDGSINRVSASFSGLLRNHKGDPICAFVSKAPADTDDVFSVEIWAIWRGLVLALGLGVRVIWVESDSLSVVNTIKGFQSHNSKAITFTCVKHIQELMRKFIEFKISHSWRETNAAADYLAKMNLSGDDVVLWPGDFPGKLCKIIQDEAQGKTYYRG